MENTLNLTKYWLEDIVLGLDLCPFARIPYQKDQIRISICDQSTEEEQLGYFLEELDLLHQAKASDISIDHHFRLFIF